MRTKTAYRANNNSAPLASERIDSPGQLELPVESQPPAIPAEALAEATTPPNDTTPQQDDDASAALRRQLDALRKSEAIHKNAPQGASREYALRLWRQQGLTEKEVHFLEENPELLDRPALLGAAANEAARLHPRDSEAFFAATKENFTKYRDAPPVTPDFFRAPPPPPAPSVAVSAPVSRTVPSSERIPVQIDPNRVHLSAAEVEIARTSGISTTEYARQKLRLEHEKRAGLRQG